MSVKGSNLNPGNESVVRVGYLKKFKTFKKKYFVLRAEGPESSARLEYYDSEKKFNNGQAPKRCIPLKTCFNINKRVDTKHKHVIALYTKDDCFCIVLESEEELEAWLKALLSLQHGEEAADGETPRPTFGKRLTHISSSRSDGNIWVSTRAKLWSAKSPISLLSQSKIISLSPSCFASYYYYCSWPFCLRSNIIYWINRTIQISTYIYILPSQF